MTDTNPTKSTELRRHHGILVVTVRDSRVMDQDRIDGLADEVARLGSDPQNGCLLLNLEHVKFLSSAALNKLIIVDKRLRDSGRRIRLCGLRPEVAEVFQITNLNKVFEIYPDEADALKAMSGGTA